MSAQRENVIKMYLTNLLFVQAKVVGQLYSGMVSEVTQMLNWNYRLGSAILKSYALLTSRIIFSINTTI